MRPWILAEANYAYVKENPYEVAVLPLGATEPHNLHLPYGTDWYEGTDIGERICEAAHKRGAKVTLLPPIPYGTETNMHKFPLAMNVDPTTLFSFVTDLIHSLINTGIKKIVLLNSHGGNEMKPLLRELADKVDAHIFLTSWFKILEDVYFDIFDEMEDHAGEMETSLIEAFHPELVAKNEDGTFAADNGDRTPMRFEALNKGWVGITRPWHLLTTNSGSGNPHGASAEKGRKVMEVIVERLSKFIVELSDAEIDETFPF